jgi:hypothetical protein
MGSFHAALLAAAAVAAHLVVVCLSHPVPKTAAAAPPPPTNIPHLVSGPTWTTRGADDPAPPRLTRMRGFALRAKTTSFIKRMMMPHRHRHNSHVMAAPASAAAAAEGTTSSFTLTKVGAKSTFRCSVVNPPTELASLRGAVERALAIIADVWESKIDVHMRLGFHKDTDNPDDVAIGGGTPMVDFGPPGGGLGGQLVPVGAAEAMIGREINGLEAGKDQFDILVKLNTATPWYTGVDSRPGSGEYDLVTVLMREMYHSLMFSGSIVLQKGFNSNKMSARLLNHRATRFDSFLASRDACSVLGYLDASDPSVRDLVKKTGKSSHELFATALQSKLYFAYNTAKAGRPMTVARMTAPLGSPSSWSLNHHLHVSERGDRLMSDRIGRGEAVHFVGRKIRAMQAAFLDSRISGAFACRGLLEDPVLQRSVCSACQAASAPAPVVLPAVSSTSSPVTTAVYAVPTTNAPVTTSPPMPYPQTPKAAGGAAVYPPATEYPTTTTCPTTQGTTLANQTSTFANGTVIGGGAIHSNGSKGVGGLPVWAFVLVILFSILAAAILIALCVLMCMAIRKRKSVTSGKSYTYTFGSSRSGKSRLPVAAGSGGMTFSSSEHISEYSRKTKVPSKSTYQGIVVPPSVKTEKKTPPVCKKPATTTTTTSSSTSKPSTVICKSSKPSRHHHHHHHHCKKYYCHCCRCKGKVESSKHSTSKYSSSKYTSKHSSSKHTTTIPSVQSSSSHKRKCCPCRKCKTSNTIRIHVC